MVKRARDLADKLRRAFERGQQGTPLRDFLQRRALREAAAKPLVELPAGIEVENAAGKCYVRESRYAFDHLHGSNQLELGRTADFGVLAQRAKDPAFEQVALSDCLFLDTETTGLSGGAGTTVFMTGIGFFERREFVLEQVFLRSFADEPAALRHVADRLIARPVQVTFVGKCFDRHRLAARMTLHRVVAPILDPLHLDLYYLARRAWKDELPDVRLQTVERERLGLARADDLPGSAAPQAFLDWLRDGTGPIERVFEHNRLDVLTLVTLLGVLGREA